ncbi:MAG: hypothetical protein KAT32_03090, partial [Candidatus Moranbacteria bacterium]|nr:hypothetical protein [Candidatus Moranbacteria bacterium]
EDLIFKTDDEERMRITEDGYVEVKNNDNKLTIKIPDSYEGETIFEVNQISNPDPGSINATSFAFMEGDGDNILRGLGSWTNTFNDSVETAYFQTSTQALSSDKGNAAFSSFRGAPYNRLVYIVNDRPSWKTGTIFTDKSSQIEPPTGYFTVRQENDTRTDFIIDYDGNFGIGQSTPTARTHIKGSTSDNSAYTLKVDDSSNGSLFNVRNDGLVSTVGARTKGYIIKDTDYTITNSDTEIIDGDTDGGIITLTLPATPIDGIIFTIKNTGTSANNLTIDRNGNNIDGAATDLTVTDNDSVRIQYTSDGWKIR